MEMDGTMGDGAVVAREDGIPPSGRWGRRSHGAHRHGSADHG